MSIVLGLNSILGIGVLESRFEPFMIISIIVFGSLGLVEILKHVFSSSFLRYLVLTAILLIACFQGWNATAYYLAHRENNKAYQHLSPSQEEVFQWMKENLPTNAVVAQSDPLPDGIVRWLPVISDRGSFNTKIFTEKSCAELMEEMVKLPTTHVIFFTKYQVVPDFYQNNPQLFKLLYDKNDSLIFQLPIEQIKNSNDKNTLCTNQ
jgi:hypothetical protein